MSDLISREAAFDEIIWNSDNGLIDAKVAIEALRKLPSVEPERKTGKWIAQHIIGSRNFDMTVCSECREEFSYDAETGITIDNYEYCPKCGAKMEVKE